MGWKLGSLSVVKALGQADTCDFIVEDPHGTVSFAPQQSVSVLNFFGTIQDVDLQYVEGGPNSDSTLYRWSVKCIGEQAYIRDRLTRQQSWANAYAETIASELGNMTGLMIAWGGPVNSLALCRFQTDVEPLGEALDRLVGVITGLTGSQYVWQISGGLIRIYAYPEVYAYVVLGLRPGMLRWKRGSLRVGQSLDPSSVNTVVLKHDRYLLNRRAPEGVNPGIGDEYYTGSDLSDTALQVLFPMAGTPTVTVNGESQEVGIDGVDDVITDFSVSFAGIDTEISSWPGLASLPVPPTYDWFWTSGSNVLRYNGGTLSPGDEIRVQYQPLDLRYLVLKDTASLATFGVRQRLITLGDSLSSAYPALEAIAKLRLGTQVSTRIRCTVRVPTDFFYDIGQALGAVTDTAAGQFLLRSVRYHTEGLVLWCDLELVQGPLAQRMIQFITKR